MAEGDKKPSENETVLMALDQVSQTIDVMNGVLGRLRNYLQQQQEAAAKQNTEAPVKVRQDRVLH